MANERIRDFVVGEMNKGSAPDVPFATGVDHESLIAGDDKPLFVTLPVAKVGKSKNGRFYSKEVILEIEEQINTTRPGGILGHISEEERATRYDLPQVIWVGAKSQGDTVYAKGYIPEYARDLRSFLNSAQATGHQIATSIYGRWPQVLDAETNSMRVLPGGTLENIDFAPAARAGMDLKGPMTLSAEMADEGLEVHGTVQELLDPANQQALIDAVMAAVKGETDGKEPGTYVRVAVTGSTYIPDPERVDLGEVETPRVNVSIDTSSEKYGSGENTMERSEIVKSLTIAELADVPTAVREHLEAQTSTAVRNAQAEVIVQIAEAVGLDKDATLPRVIGAVAEMQSARTAAEVAARKSAVDAQLEEGLKKFAVDAPAEDAERVRKVVRRMAVAEMKAETPEEALRPLTLLLDDADITYMVENIIKKGTDKTLPAHAAVPGAVVAAASEMAGNPPTVAPVNANRAETRDGKVSAFKRNTVQGPSNTGSQTAGIARG